jgi:hypothetical protein
MIKKNINISLWVIAFAVSQFLFSCNTSVEIAKRHYQSGYYVNIHKKHNDVKQSSIAKVVKEHLQPITPVAPNNENYSFSTIENQRVINDNEIASTDNSSPIILKNNLDFSNSENSLDDNSVSSSKQNTLLSKSNSSGGNDLGYYATKWLIYLGLAILATFVAILLSGTSALGFSYLLFVIGGVMLLLAIIYFIKWVSFL